MTEQSTIFDKTTMNFKNYIQKTIDQTILNHCDKAPSNHNIDIIIPVYNGYDALKKNVASLLQHTEKRHKIHYYNDASTDQRIKPFLDQICAEHQHISVLHRDVNSGYLKNVNQAMLASTEDVILLNADTQVTKNWLNEIINIAAEPEVAIVCPLSNNATILSIQPDLLSKIDKRSHFSGQWYSLPTAVGSCMLIKRAIIDQFGVFDEYYDPGYGEECDYSFKIRSAGHQIACAPASFVYHEGSVSFQSDANTLKQQHQQLLDLRWPQYQSEIANFIENNPIVLIEEYLHADSEEKNILHVVHGIENKGGVELFTKEFISGLPDDINNTIFLPHPIRINSNARLIKKLNKQIRLVYFPLINQKVENKIGHQSADLYNENLDALFIRQLLSGSYNIVHFHSLVSMGSMMWPLICQALGINYMISSHDHFSVCFNYSLLTNNYTEYCKKTYCSSKDQQCVNCLSQLTNHNTLPIKDFITQRNDLWVDIVNGAAHTLVPSQYSYDLFNTRFNSLNPKTTHVVEPYHFTDVEIKAKKHHSNTLCVAYLGGFSNEKGADIFLEAYEQLKSKDIEWKVIGIFNKKYKTPLSKTGITCTGVYERDDLPELLENVDIVIIPSIRPETYCITLTEAWLNGIPVIASDCGALKSRIKDRHNGLLFNTGDASDLVEKITLLTTDRKLLNHISKNIKQIKFDKTMACSEILAIYHELLQDKNVTRQYCKKDITRMSIPQKNAYSKMNQWLYADMVLEAESDWQSPHSVNIIILGNDHNPCQATHLSCQTYAPDSPILQVQTNEIDLNQDDSILCIIKQGHLLNDNFGNWVNAFIASDKYLGLADYALINADGEIYAPQFQADFHQFNYHSKKHRIGAILCHHKKLPDLAQQFNDLFANNSDFHTLIDLIYHQNQQDNIHYFPHLSYLFNDASWVQLWKKDLLEETIKPTATSKEAANEVAVVLSTNLTDKALKKYLSQIYQQTQINIRHVYIFSSQYIKCENKGMSAHYIDFRHPHTYINAVLSRNDTPFLLFINDNLSLNNDNIFSDLLIAMQQFAIEAASPVYTLKSGNDDSIYSEKMGAGKLSARGMIADKRFDRKEIPQIVDLLDEDFFVLSKKAWQQIGGLDMLSNVYFKANCISSQLFKSGFDITVIPVKNLYRTNLPSYALIDDDRPLDEVRNTLFDDNKSFYKKSRFYSKSFNAQYNGDLDQYFGLFKTPKNLPRVLAYANDTWASGFYRVKAPISALAASDHISSLFLPNQQQFRLATAFEINKSSPNVLLLHNFVNDDQVIALKEYKHFLDMPIILSFDDLLTEIPAYNPFAQNTPDNIEHNITEACRYADKLIVSTEYLADKFKIFHHNITVVNNFLPKELWLKPFNPAQKNNQSKPRIGWAGAGQHQKDLEWLSTVIEATKEHVQWVFYGDKPDGMTTDVIEYHRPTTLMQYHTTLKSLKLDMAIAPLVDNSFNHAKSNLKLLEYGALSLPTICSDTKNYINSPAIVIENDPQKWTDAILELANNTALRTQKAQLLYQWVHDHYFLEDHLDQWSSALALS